MGGNNIKASDRVRYSKSESVLDLRGKNVRIKEKEEIVRMWNKIENIGQIGGLFIESSLMCGDENQSRKNSKTLF